MAEIQFTGTMEQRLRKLEGSVSAYCRQYNYRSEYEDILAVAMLAAVNTKWNPKAISSSLKF